MLSKKAVFFILLVVIVISSINTSNNIYKKLNKDHITGKASTAQLSFSVQYTPSHYNVTSKIFFLPDLDGAVVSGLPMGVWVNVTYMNGTAVPNATVKFTETNGWSPFAVTQYWPTNAPFTEGVTSYQIAETKTDDEGLAIFTTTSTGGDSGNEALIGNYLLNLSVYHDGMLLNSTIYPSEDRGLPSPNGTTHFLPNNQNPNRWVNEVRDKLLTIYNRIKAWNGGEVSSITVYTNNTDNGTIITAISGQPLGIKFTVLDWNTKNPVSNAIVTVTEDNGYSTFAMTQYWPTNPPFDAGVSNFQIAETVTDSFGQANLTIVPTGGDSGNENLVGNYNVTINITVSGINIYSQGLSIGDRGLSTTGTGVPLPNNDAPNRWINEGRDKLLTLYNRIKGWT